MRPRTPSAGPPARSVKSGGSGLGALDGLQDGRHRRVEIENDLGVELEELGHSEGQLETECPGRVHVMSLDDLEAPTAITEHKPADALEIRVRSHVGLDFSPYLHEAIALIVSKRPALPSAIDVHFVPLRS